MHNSIPFLEICSLSAHGLAWHGIASRGWLSRKRQVACRDWETVGRCALAKAGELSNWHRGGGDWHGAVLGMQVTFRLLSITKLMLQSATAWWRRQALARPEPC